MRPSRNLKGNRFGKLTAIEKVNDTGKAFWICECECGRKTIVSASNLIKGNTKSCGCYQRERTSQAKKVHGERHTRLYAIWIGMRARCLRESERCYPNYGGRGITICDEWKDSFVAFRKWAYENGYDNSLTIDRINNDGNYCPQNCRWATKKEQNNNTRANVYVTVEGETHTLSQWSEINKIPYVTIMKRRKRGWSDEKAVSLPVNSTRKKRGE